MNQLRPIPVILAITLLLPLPANADAFTDDDESIHEEAIEAIAAEGITRGCDSAGELFCPGRSVKRGAMAAFIRRSLDLPSADSDFFVDDDGSIFEDDINAIAEAGITKGCSASEDLYCPDRLVERGAMAAFLRRAFEIPPASSDRFEDDSNSPFEADINAIADAGVTRGCDSSGSRYCPFGAVTRAQMASFLARALGLGRLGLPQPTEPDEIITGSVCPCTVTGVAALEGKIELEGDLTVDGGILVARPGVALDGNGHEIRFTNGGQADFQGTEVFTWSDNGSQVNLQRDITFTNLARIMFHDGAGPSLLKYLSLSNSGIEGKRGFYPLHWHLNGNTTRGTIVEGVVVVNGRNHAFVPHGSNGITIKDSIAKDIRDAAFWWDRPGTNNCDTRSRDCTTDNSNDSLWDHNLVDGVTTAGDGNRLTAYMLGAGSGNVVRDSVGINIHGERDCSAFHWPEWANLNAGGNVWVFENNHGESDCHGIFVWQNGPNIHAIDGFTGDAISQGAYTNKYIYRNFEVSSVVIHARGWEMEDGHAGDVLALKHQNGTWPTVVSDNVTMDSFTVNNAEDSGSNPGQYILNGSGLACDDIVYANALPGTEVILDGKKC